MASNEATINLDPNTNVLMGFGLNLTYIFLYKWRRKNTEYVDKATKGSLDSFIP